MENHQKTILGCSLIAGIVAISLFIGYRHRQDLRVNKVISFTTIYKFSENGKHTCTALHYKYKVEGNGTEGELECSGISIKNVHYFVDKTFPLIYSKKYPENHAILIFPDQFAEYDLPFPDSLHWVLKYAN